MLSELDALATIEAPLRSFDALNHAFFVSGERCILAQHVHHRFTSNIDCHDTLVKTVQSELAKCRSEDAIAFGVVPFCKSEAAQFIVSEHVQTLNRSQFSAQVAAQSTIERLDPPTLLHVDYRQGKPHYLNAIKRAKTLFEKGELEKIVLAKQVDLHFNHSVSKTQVIANLLKQNTHGFPFAFPLQSGATLVGVSPELLLKKQGDTINSNPLAGSAKRAGDCRAEVLQQRDLLNSKKDRYEHAVVLIDMAQVLEPWCTSLDIPSCPSLLSTATMWHLSSEIEGTLIHPAPHVLAIANRLHPTPALCGKPTQHAYPWIQTLEGSSRNFFSGIVGWCDKHGNGEWVVVIRSGELHQNHVRLFAGAGIVHSSEPDAEWHETEAKLSTMLNALNVSTDYREHSAQYLETTLG
ncbi:Isochorismate synthase [Pseudoalteromonas luteoviolacea B = ATCC 29581]|nr:Isochorismate synthase [Pseudoalteromonas luteoviolacea B = ATCC 29581]